ncbi:hypothetical protein HNS33_21995 [Enterobacter roggenkampii]|uniref:DUF676 domain-containing protein n=1 Tax=Enterobacter roggenkampii TaxID=1812935 RepID=A0A7G8AFX7_9ENTR|nr:hypothetical protein [Enterobacter roggenkampii]MBA2155528.1 hypothetical protein [Enterobacter roggenkampii]QNI18518.1 hypothetical protein [Enterobacter roggenkampii]
MSKLHLISGPKNASRHVILFHGLQGHYYNTWMAEKKKSLFWPDWLQQDNPEIAIWSIEYETNVLTRFDPGMEFKDRAKNIYELLLRKNELREGEIILIGHSLGGLIIKQIIRYASDHADNESSRCFLNRICGIAFLGTPHTGSDLASSGKKLLPRVIIKLMTWYEPSAITSYLCRNSAELRDLNVWYRKWERQFPRKHLILGESKPVKFSLTIVKPDSSDPGLSAEMIMVDSDHGGICKPDSRNHEVYVHLRDFIESIRIKPQHLWLRSQFGPAVRGWYGYRNWSGSSNNSSSSYIIDAKVKFADTIQSSATKISAEDMINTVRGKLATTGTILRLVGLSGVGKTRFIQALFESDVGHSVLSRDAVYYTDTSFSPLPEPMALLEKMISSGVPGIIIVDNCASTLHKSLVTIIKSSSVQTKISLLTVEYDIRDDIPENTDVITMEANSDELIKKLVEIQYPDIQPVNLDKITEFSCGNARVAMALASVTGQSGNISRLRDEELFRKLFNQGHGENHELMRAGEILSLVYSFRYEDGNEKSQELASLSSISHISYKELYAFASEIKRRGLAQTRGSWMAILPHPIANKLAVIALDNIPGADILAVINPDNNARMFKSFTHRLGYLSDSSTALKIVSNMLSCGGIFEKMLTEGKKTSPEIFNLITNVAPIAESQVIEFIERISSKDTEGIFFTRGNPAWLDISRLLRSLAYEAQYFTRCVTLLCSFAEKEKSDERNNSTIEILCSLFTISLSGTHAPLEQRIAFIQSLLDRNNKKIAFRLIDKILKTHHFISSYGFSFGANVRDYGYIPRSFEEYQEWYSQSLTFCLELTKRDKTYLADITPLISKYFSGLWDIPSTQTLIYYFIKDNISTLDNSIFWSVIKRTIKYSKKNKGRERIEELENLTRPISVEQKLQVFVFASSNTFPGLNEVNEQGKVILSGHEKARETAKELGRVIGTSRTELIDGLLADALTNDYNYDLLEIFAGELAHAITDYRLFYEKIESYILQSDILKIKNVFLCACFKSIYERDSDFCHERLDKYVQMAEMDSLVQYLQASVPIDERSTNRIITHLRNPQLVITGYFNLASGRRHQTISDNRLVIMLTLLWPHKNGPQCIFEILSMRFLSEKDGDYHPDDDLIRCAQEFVLTVIESEKISPDEIWSHNIKVVAARVFAGGSGSIINRLIDSLIKALNHYTLYQFDSNDIVIIICENHPLELLERLCPKGGSINDELFDVLNEHSQMNNLPLTTLSPQLVFRWCTEDPALRFPCIASLIMPFDRSGEHYNWTPMAKMLIESSPAPEMVLNNFSDYIIPHELSGSPSAAAEARMSLVSELRNHERDDIACGASKVFSVLQEKLRYYRLRETDLRRAITENFEP